MTSVKALSEIPDDQRHVLTYLGTLMDQARQRVLAENIDGLRSSQLRVIALVPPDGVTVTELAQRAGMTKQGIGQFVGALSASGHLAVQPDSEDRRIKLVKRTADGDRVTERLDVLVRALEDEWAHAVGRKRYTAFRSLLEELALR